MRRGYPKRSAEGDLQEDPQPFRSEARHPRPALSRHGPRRIPRLCPSSAFFRGGLSLGPAEDDDGSSAAGARRVSVRAAL